MHCKSIFYLYKSILLLKFVYDQHILIMVWTFWDCFLKTQLLVIDFSQYWHINSVPQNKFLYAAEEFFCCKSLFTLSTNKLLFPSGKYHMVVHFHLSSIGLSTLNAPINKWFLVFGLVGWLVHAKYKFNMIFPAWFLSRHVMT